MQGVEQLEKFSELNLTEYVHMYIYVRKYIKGISEFKFKYTSIQCRTKHIGLIFTADIIIFCTRKYRFNEEMLN